MGNPITADELRDRLKRERSVEVCGASFLIRRVPLLFLGEDSDDFWKLARDGKDALSQRINAIVANPKLPQFRRVLLYGVVAPRLGVVEDDNDAVPVDQVLADYPLAVGLYVAIINLTLESIPKQEV